MPHRPAAREKLTAANSSVTDQNELDTKTGTEWCEPGEGATGRELEVAIAGAPVKLQYGKAQPTAWCAARALPRRKRTNLRLTGASLTMADLERIARCEVAR